MGLIGLDGQPIGTESNKGKITKSQAGAVITSELDIAIERWNVASLQQACGIAENAHLFKAQLKKHEYSPAAKEKTNLFGYVTFTIEHRHKGIATEIYSKGANFAKENELNNVNGYYPDMAIDCMGFLLASGLLYNLALVEEKRQNAQENNEQPEGKQSLQQPGSDESGSGIGTGREPGSGSDGSAG